MYGSHEMTSAELPIYVVAWIGVPNKPNYLDEKLTVYSELGITCFQKREGSTTDARVLGAEHPIDV
jgi:hypothetical protein